MRRCLETWVGVVGVAGGMAQWVRVLATKPDHQSLVPGTHVVEGENCFLKILFLYFKYMISTL